MQDPLVFSLGRDSRHRDTFTLRYDNYFPSSGESVALSLGRLL